MQVYIDSPIILNGVCLRWKGYINLEKLDGVGGMKFDEDSSRVSSFKGVSDLKTLLDYSYVSPCLKLCKKKHRNMSFKKTNGWEIQIFHDFLSGDRNNPRHVFKSETPLCD